MKPMLCESIKIENAKEMLNRNWVIEEKYDGVRAYIKNGKLYNRRGKDITHKFPEFEGLEEFQMFYDGEIVAQSGEFSDISGRMHLKDDFKMKLSAKVKPAIFKIFDVVGDTKEPLESRRKMLEETNFEDYDWIEVAEQYDHKKIEERWQDVLENGKEGLVLKRKTSTYKEGKRSSDWLKVKAWKEAEVEFNQYEEHPRGITIENDKGQRVVVNGVQADDVAKKIEKKGSIIAEIQYLEQNNSDEWRFPSFKRIKGEV